MFKINYVRKDLGFPNLLEAKFQRLQEHLEII